MPAVESRPTRREGTTHCVGRREPSKSVNLSKSKYTARRTVRFDRIADRITLVADPHVVEKIEKVVRLLEKTGGELRIGLEDGSRDRDDFDFFDATGGVDLELVVDDDVLDELAKGVIDE